MKPVFAHSLKYGSNMFSKDDIDGVGDHQKSFFSAPSSSLSLSSSPGPERLLTTSNGGLMSTASFISTSGTSISMPSIPSLMTAPNPLKVFPAHTKREDFEKSLLMSSVPKHARILEGKTRWLQADSVDPNFGISGSSQEVEVRRAFRRINSSVLFVPSKPEQVALTVLYVGHRDEQVEKKPKNFVMVEESRLAELTQFENILRDEKVKLAEQVAWVVKDLPSGTINPWIPLPATRYAIHSICESDMRRFASDISKLNASWDKYCKDNNYYRSVNRVFGKESYVNRAPLALRAMKFVKAKDAADNWLIKRDRDNMMFEDDMSFYVDKYIDAQNRKRDYDRYFVLASRYNNFSEEDYYATSNPGKIYFKKVLDATIKFQRVWGPYWARKSKKRIKSVIMIQKRWRRYWCRKTIYPIIRIRRKIGFRTYLFWCWSQWKDYNRVVKAIKDSIAWYRYTFVRLCWASWKGWAQGEVDRKNRIRRNFLLQMKYKYVKIAFLAWRADSVKTKALKRRLRRTFQLPEFGIWCRYTEWRREMKRIGKAATKIQSIYRRNKYLVVWKKKKLALVKFRDFLFIILTKKLANCNRESRIRQEFIKWEPSESVRRTFQANDKERKRALAMQTDMADREKKSIKELKSHLSSPKGSWQLDGMRGQFTSSLKVTERLDHGRTTLNEMAWKQTIDRCAALNRIMAQHDYQVKNPPLCMCAVPSCKAIFTMEDQYLRHERNLYNDSVHSTYLVNSALLSYDDPDFLTSYSQFHQMISNAEGFTSLKEYLATTPSNYSRPGSNAISSSRPGSKGAGSRRGSIWGGSGGGESSATTSKKNKSVESDSSWLGSSFLDGFSEDVDKKEESISNPNKSYIDCLDAWKMIQELKMLPCHDVNFHRLVIKIYDTFLTQFAPQSIASLIPEEEINKFVDKIIFLKERDKELEDERIRVEGLVKLNPKYKYKLPVDKNDGFGFFSKRRLGKTILQNFLGWDGDIIVEWSEKYIILPSSFQEIEWHCFYSVFSNIALDIEFVKSVEYKRYLTIAAGLAHKKHEAYVDDYRKHRLMQFTLWTKSFLQKEKDMKSKAYLAVDNMMDKKLDKLLDRSLDQLIADHVKEIRYKEQVAHEHANLLAEEVIDFYFSNFFEDQYAVFLNSLFKMMLAEPKLTVILLKRAGMHDSAQQPAKKLMINMNAKNEAADMFKNLFAEDKSKPKEVVDFVNPAAKLIQKMYRGVLARKKVRKMFVTRYTKKLDNISGHYYYENTHTLETSWSRPRIMKYLYPKSKW